MPPMCGDAADVPKNFDGLMRPALRDNMGLAGDDTGARIIGAMVRAKTEGFVKRLKEQNIRMHMMAGSAQNTSGAHIAHWSSRWPKCSIR